MNRSFLIQRYIETADWHPVTISNDLIHIQSYPVHGDLLPAAALIGKELIRLGYCTVCSYTTYMDRPSLEWFKNFYDATWDQDNQGKHKSPNKLLVSLVNELPRDASILEIGCGHGENLRHLQENGFTRCMGIEPSEHRVTYAQQRGLLALKSSFEGFKDYRSAPFDVIYSFHVFEHLYEPKDSIRKCSELQKEGGMLILAVPNLRGEPSWSTVFYLPHIHSYTPRFCYDLLAEFGYQVIQDHTTDKEIFVVARKQKMVKNEIENNINPVRKLTEALGVNKPQRSILWGYRKLDLGGQVSRPLWPVFRKLHAYINRKQIMQREGAFRFQRKTFNVLAARISPIRATTDIPLEIHYPEDITLFYK